MAEEANLKETLKLLAAVPDEELGVVEKPAPAKKPAKASTAKSAAKKTKSAKQKPKKPAAWTAEPGVMRTWLVSLTNGTEETVRAPNGAVAIAKVNDGRDLRANGRAYAAQCIDR